MTILSKDKNCRVSEAALLSEASLAEDWNRPEEDAVWSYLQSAQIDEPQISKVNQEVPDDELCSEYRFVYSKGRPNRFINRNQDKPGDLSSGDSPKTGYK